MSSLTDPSLPFQNSKRYSKVNQQKSSGATYTPVEFADFVAAQIVSAIDLPEFGVIRVLDPAVGDGALLDSIINHLPENVHERLVVCGYDTDIDAVSRAGEHLKTKFPNLNIQIEQKDFIEYLLEINNESDLFSNDDSVQKDFHIVIANPPYVRTQIIGAQQAQRLAQSFGLSGRVDLYYPFMLGISQVLCEGGVTGIITSNRFLTTKSGQAVRRELLSRFDIQKVWDLGDTKLFNAAVLPAVMLAKGVKGKPNRTLENITFSTIYETKNNAEAVAVNALTALNMQDNTVVSISDGRKFIIRHGSLDNGNQPEGVWRISTKSGDQWLATVDANTWDQFRRIGKIRVGVKSTADKVFIRSDWSELSGGRPELLRPLITRHCGRQFKACVPIHANKVKEIIYPYDTSVKRRTPVDLNLYPKTLRYLEQHRDILESRTYLIDAGRAWYELWVPQSPSAWSTPKIVFLDISEQPTFWMDTEGGIVNGECYWFQCDQAEESDLLWLALAVANSTFIESFYDHCFNNKLYSGRRRFITQYVERFPLPDPDREESKVIVDLAKSIHSNMSSSTVNQQISELNVLVWKVFGLDFEEVPR